MKFKIDENLGESTKSLLLKCGHDCHSVHDEGLRGAEDDLLIDICKNEQRHLITLDLDFADIVGYPPSEYHGIVVFRLSRQDALWLNARLEKIISELVKLELIGHLVIVSDDHIRYR